jgi:hypothetical protein
MKSGLYLKVDKSNLSDKGSIVYFSLESGEYTHVGVGNPTPYSFHEWNEIFDFHPIEITEYLVTRTMKVKVNK